MPADGKGDGHLADRIYEAAVLPEFWPEVLRDFADAADSLGAVLIATGEQGLRWTASSERFAELAAKHYDYPGGQERTRRLLALRHPGFATDRDAFSDEEIATDPLFTELLIPQGLGRGVATAVEVPAGDTIVLHAEGDLRKGPLPAETVERLNLLRPHVARSALISARLAFERARTAVETLSALGHAACAVSPAGVVVVANGEFEAEQGYWTTRGGGHVALEDRRSDALLREAISAGALGTRVRSVPLRPQGDLAPAVLHVVPLRRAALDLFANAGSILVLTKGSSSPTGATPLLQALFDLSATEAAVAAGIAAGQTAQQIALAGGKSVATVRNQIKSVLEKTGCARQVDLARLLAQVVPPGPYDDPLDRGRAR